MSNPPPAARSASVANRRAVTAAGHRDDEATVRSYLADPDPAVRAAALGALARLDALTAADLGPAMTDGDVGLRRRAVELAAGVDDVDLMASLADADATVVEMAAWSCGERSATPQVIDALSALVLDHDDALCREAAVAALGALGDPAGLPAILAGCRDKATVRRRAVLALAPFATPEVTAQLTASLEDRDWQVRQAAEDLIGPASD